MTHITRNPKEQLVNELCANGHLEIYRETIKDLLEEINMAGATVSCKYNVAASNIDPSEERPSHIRVSMIQVKTPLNILWNMLHEFGHYQDYPRIPDHSTIQREITAWELAEQVVIKYPQLLSQIESFHTHKSWCLGTYYKKYGIPKGPSINNDGNSA